MERHNFQLAGLKHRLSYVELIAWQVLGHVVLQAVGRFSVDDDGSVNIAQK